MINFYESVEKSEAYLYSLSVDGKVFYIGKTINPKVRYKHHVDYYRSGNNKKKTDFIHAAINNGKQVVMNVFWGGKLDEWQKMERYWIAKYRHDWQIPLLNIASGGNQVEITDEVKLKLSQKLKGRKLSESTKLKMKGRNPWNKGKKIHQTKKVAQYLNGQLINVFDSIKHAGESTGINRGNISLVVNGKRHTLNGYSFRYHTD